MLDIRVDDVKRRGDAACLRRFAVAGQDLRADSMAAMTVGSSGKTSGEKRAATLPRRSMRNFSKFQRMPGSGLVGTPLCLLLRKPLRFSRKLSRVAPMALGWAAMRDW